MFRAKNFLLTIIFGVAFFLSALGQSEVINNAKTALKSGSSKELSRYCNKMVELNFDGEKSSYSKTQAEFVLRDFFKKHPPTDFEYIHQGASKEGLKYVAHVFSPKFITKFSAVDLEVRDLPVSFETFDNIENAQDWLRQKIKINWSKDWADENSTIIFLEIFTFFYYLNPY